MVQITPLSRSTSRETTTVFLISDPPRPEERSESPDRASSSHRASLDEVPTVPARISPGGRSAYAGGTEFHRRNIDNSMGKNALSSGGLLFCTRVFFSEPAFLLVVNDAANRSPALRWYWSLASAKLEMYIPCVGAGAFNAAPGAPDLRTDWFDFFMTAPNGFFRGLGHGPPSPLTSTGLGVISSLPSLRRIRASSLVSAGRCRKISSGTVIFSSDAFKILTPPAIQVWQSRGPAWPLALGLHVLFSQSPL